MSHVPSPCIGTCWINIKSGLCQGCHRTTEEIANWQQMGDEHRRQVIQLVEQRQSEVRFSE